MSFFFFFPQRDSNQTPFTYLKYLNKAELNAFLFYLGQYNTMGVGQIAARVTG